MLKKLSKLSAIMLALALVLMLAIPAAAGSYNDTFAAQVLSLTNAERAKKNLPALKTNTNLTNAAKQRAWELSTMEHLLHERPNGDDALTVFAEFGFVLGVNCTAQGENIASGQPTPADAVDGWMNSPTHKANILGDFSSQGYKGDFTHMGVGVYSELDENENLIYYWVQLFLNDGSVPITPAKPVKVPFWNSWPGWIVWIMKWLLCGWAWMWMFS